MPTVSVTSTVPQLVFRLQRDQDVPDGFWIQLTARFTLDPRHPTKVVHAPADQLLSLRQWLRQTCRTWHVSLRWDDTARTVLHDVLKLQDELRKILDDPPRPVGSDSLATTLAETRFVGVLRDFQLRDLAKLQSLPHGANYSVPGAGKTAVTYGLYELERAAGRVNQLVVVAPLSAFEAWAEEADKWLDPSPRHGPFNDSPAIAPEVSLIHYQRLAKWYDELASHITSAPTHLVLDEAHRIKRGWSGEWGAACLRLAFLARRRDVLTGTPAPNRLRDLVPLVDFCWPGQTSAVFSRSASADSPPAAEIAAVARRIRPLFVRTNKGELGLPPPKISVVQITMGPLQKEIYDALRHRFAGKALLSRSDETNLAQMGRMVMYLLEAASNPALLGAGSSDSDPTSFRHPPLAIPDDARLVDLIGTYAQYETPPKFLELVKIVADSKSEGSKTLVWSHFVRNLEWLHNHVLANAQPAMVHGGVPVEAGRGVTRQEEIDRFRNDPECSVLLANPAAMSEGVSLHQVCNSAVYVDRTFNAGQFLQSQDRIHRLGLLPGVTTKITILQTLGTIDQVVDNRLASKVAVLASLMTDADLPTMALPDEDDYGPAVEAGADIDEILRHLSHA